MRRWLWVASVASVAVAAGLVGCGGKLVPERSLIRDAEAPPLHDAGVEAGPSDGGADADDADDGQVDSNPPDAPPPDACAEMAPPRCVPTATCGSMYLLKGEGLEQGYFYFETVDVPCQTPATIVQQLINGAWVTLPSLANKYIPNETSTDTYIVGSQFPFSSPQEGATVGSIQAIRGCLTTGACTVCDPPQNITVLQCGACLPKNCGPGLFLDVDCRCVTDICPCPLDTYPACVTPSYQCF
jgi:hypothetical protein